MTKLRIRGGRPLVGHVPVSGAKNAALPILAASLLAGDGESRLLSVPWLNDVVVMLDLLQTLGVEIETDGANTVYLRAGNLSGCEAPYELVNRMRASVLIMGPLLARLGRARISLPGGCAIGSRPIDLHLKGFTALGADVTVGHGFVEAEAPQLRGAHIYLDYPSVGATENIMMAASLATGTTIIENAAAEPEITNLGMYLNNMGVDIRGCGTDRIEIRGMEHLKGATQTIIPDRIEAATYLMAAIMTQGQVTIGPIDSCYLHSAIAKLREAGADIETGEDQLIVRPAGPLRSIDVQTLPYPGFPTDLQPQLMALLTQAHGASLITETVFENRFLHVPELCRMGAEIKVIERRALVRGPARLTGTTVAATDLRAGAALILAGLVAEGETYVTETYHINRGYVKIVDKLQALGADVEQVPEAD
ncbi:MAG: UDP-N-acetylglucosamine 1-carboxyvinyltransferase [Firmicutes bacterium]|nr:UDP-N-acetylglucosamine 1-carboxyvinyltransferase [Bacillota bacterium]